MKGWKGSLERRYYFFFTFCSFVRLNWPSRKVLIDLLPTTRKTKKKNCLGFCLGRLVLIKSIFFLLPVRFAYVLASCLFAPYSRLQHKKREKKCLRFCLGRLVLIKSIFFFLLLPVRFAYPFACSPGE